MNTSLKLIGEISKIALKGKIRVNGVDLFYECCGKGKHPVLMLPGVLGCVSGDLGPQLRGLNREEFTLVGVDPRGYGRSIPPKRDFPLEFLLRDAEDAVKLMDTIGFSKFSVVGWSDGGNIATMIASKYPERVKKLVVWASNTFCSTEDLKIFKSVMDFSKLNSQMKRFMSQMYGEEYFRTTWNQWIEGSLNTYEHRDNDAYKKKIERIEAPTLIIHGMKDHFVDITKPIFLHKHIKQSKIIFWKEGSHSLHLENPTKFNTQVEKFLLGDENSNSVICSL